MTKRPRRTWRRAAGGAGAALLVALAPAARGGAPAPTSQTILLAVELPDRPTAGAQLFARKGCVRCHSLAGAEARIGPDLGRILFTGSVLDLAGAFWNHAPVMREKMRDLKIPPPTMSSEEMADIVALLTAYRYYLTEVGVPGDPVAGRRVFVAKGCRRCHGEDPNAWERIGPSLQRYRGRSSAIFIAQAMWNHGPEMAAVMQQRGVAWPQFVGREMGDLIAYLQAGTAGRAAEPIYFEPGSPRRGRELFRRKGCLTCHAVAGVGGRGGPDLGTGRRELVRSVPEIAGLMWNHSLRMMAEFRRRGLAPVTFSGQEMADIIAYLYFINYATVRGAPERGGRVFVEKCSTCHTIEGGTRVGPDLATVPQLDDPFAIIAAMWNHAPRMEEELRKRGLAWPRFEPGDAADLAAYLLQRRAARRSAPSSPPAGTSPGPTGRRVGRER